MVCLIERPEDGLNPCVFIAKAMLFTLAPLLLGSLYIRLDECSVNVVRAVGRYDVVMHADSCFSL